MIREWRNSRIEMCRETIARKPSTRREEVLVGSRVQMVVGMVVIERRVQR